jgi:hypothetical protein
MRIVKTPVRFGTENFLGFPLLIAIFAVDVVDGSLVGGTVGWAMPLRIFGLAKC